MPPRHRPAYGFVTYLMGICFHFHLCVTGIPDDVRNGALSVTALIGLVTLIFDLLTSK